MTSYEIVLRNITHRSPPRPGLNFDRGRLNDLVLVGLGPSPAHRDRIWVEGGIEYREDEWGCIWHRMAADSTRGEVCRPALPDWGRLSELRVPDYDHPARYEEMRALFAGERERYKVAGMPGWIFATARCLRGMEDYFVDLVWHRREIDRLHEIIASLLERVIVRCAEAGADAILFWEDLGVQDRLMIGPAMWRDVFAPHYRRLCGVAHAHGLKVLMHSCGYNWELLDDLIDTGVDCFQFDQPALYDQPALAAKLRARGVGLWSPVDIQRVLPTGDRAFIEAEARRMVETFRGGLIVKNYPDLAGIGVEEEWDDWAYRAVLEAIGINEED